MTRRATPAPPRGLRPESGEGIVLEEYLLRRAVLDKEAADRRLTEAIEIASNGGLSRVVIDELLGQLPGGEVRRLDRAS